MAGSGKNSIWRSLGGAAIYGVVLLGAMFIGATAGWAGQSSVISELGKQKLLQTQPGDVFAEDGVKQDSLTLLVLGCDEERYYVPIGSGKAGKVTNAAARSDMMLVVKLDFEKKKITGISIPRDTYVNLPGSGHAGKINALHKFGGKELATRGAEYALGGMVHIDRTIVLNYEAFQDMVDILGGIEIYVPRNMKHSDVRGGLVFDIKKGRQKLDGYLAMCFVRYRKGDSDFMRQERQQDFMIAFKDALKANMAVAPQIAEKSIELADGEFTAKEIASLMLFAQNVGRDNIKLGMLPIFEQSGTTDLAIDTAKRTETLEEFGFISDQSSGAVSRR